MTSSSRQWDGCASLALALLMTAGVCGADEPMVGPPVPYRFTSIKTAACHSPAATQAQRFEDRDVTAKECPAVDDWQLFVVFTETASWIEIARQGVLWSSQEALTGASAFGVNPNVASDGVEWLPPEGNAETLLIHLEAREPPTANGPGKRLSRIAVIGLDGETPRFCGLAKSMEEAKGMAEKRDACGGGLQQLSWK